MQYRKTLILLFVFLALAAAAIVVQGPARRDRERVKGPVFTGFDTGKVAAITLENGDDEVVLRRSGDGWVVGEEEYRAGVEMVKSFLESLSGLKEEAVASRNPEKQKDFEIEDESGARFHLEDASGNELASAVVGKSGPGYASGYLKRKGGDEVLLVSANLRPAVTRPLAQWRDREIVKVKKEEITGVTLETGGETITIAKESGAWTVNGSPAETASVERYLGRLAGLTAAGFAAPEEYGDAGLDEPSAVIAIAAGDDDGVTVTLGAEKEKESQRYLRTDREETVYLITKWAADSLLKKPSDFPPPPPPAEEVSTGDDAGAGGQAGEGTETAPVPGAPGPAAGE